MTIPSEAGTEGTSAAPPVIDEQAAMWAASLVAPRRRDDAHTVRDLRHEIQADVPDLDAAARRWSQLGHGLPPTQARVVGRLGWVRINVSSMRGAFAPLREKLSGNRALASRVVGVQIGALFGLLSTKVLGQFVLPLGGPGGGELLVVGPNVLELAERHGDLATDIRRTVVLHEITHRLQFDGNPWLGEHLRGLVQRYLADARLDRNAVRELAPRLPRLIAEVRETGTIEPLLSAVLTEEQSRIVSQAQGLMSLLEGHGNTAMYDAAAQDLIRDPQAVRDALAERHGDVTSKLLSLAGMEMKRRQYREGEQFVRGVLELGGVTALNHAFAAPDHLPQADEVADPAGWLARVRAA
ncbi:zinc-dependent metalloprotease [Egicoccus sp. AB-alg6-2]|uniref:zinc-dependent metalloprotease n=1 Tax=Egicoccus sp. AB-alg6-2 TaxID=3242692 RepID=UPI00359D7D1B